MLTTLGSVENSATSTRPWGPRHGATAKPLSAARTRILDTLRDQSEPVTLAALVELSGLHENTVREHLEGLRGRGVVRRIPGPIMGRGRPAWLYECVDVEPEQHSYAGLAAALARALAGVPGDPEALATAAGTEWGRALVRQHPVAADLIVPEPAAAAHAALDLIDELGFAPKVDEDSSEVRLTRCPLLETAYRHPEVVCSVHLGLVKGAIAELGIDPEGTRLLPFAEPGSCLLLVPALVS